MSGTDFDRPPAKSLETLDLHLLYLQRQVGKLVDGMPLMATKADIENLVRRLDGYATQDDTRALRTDLEQLRQQVESGSVQSTVERWGTIAQKSAAVVAFVAAAAYCIVAVLEVLKR